MERNEYPRPQLMRKDWINLNGVWSFEVDNSKSGEEKEYYKRSELNGEITVPFCPESSLSGVGCTDFMECVWYRHNIEIPPEWNGKRILLHFGAADYHAKVYINGTMAGEHRGGYTPFSFDITEYLKESGNYITVCVYDDVRSHNQPAGKQSSRLYSYECSYTRTTGIWQTVWAEPVESSYIDNIRITADISQPAAALLCRIKNACAGMRISARAYYDGREVGFARTIVNSSCASLTLCLSERHLWEAGKGRLYDVVLTLEKDGAVIDEVESYFGLREVCVEGRAFKLNGKTIFGRWVLDQGFYPDGIYTAPSDEALKNDIINSMKLGFNGARLHEKIFEPRYLYWADKLGYLVWGEHANWELDITEMGQIEHFLPEWIEAVERDFSHLSIIGWCPFNETWDRNDRRQCDEIIRTVYRVTKTIDTTRPVIDTSGHFHVETDIFDLHDYEQDTEKFAENYSRIGEGIVNDAIARSVFSDRQKYDGKLPVFVSEYGGICYQAEPNGGWGYGNTPKTESEFIERYRRLTESLLDNENIMGFCYTQLYDVEQETNGLMTYNRQFKFDPEIFRKINTKKAKIEGK